jgi:predicted lactoylglutathione lyase
MVTQIFVNLPVKNLKSSIEFFTKLGFAFDEKFTDENATCMIIGDNMYAMLLVQKFFKTFTTKALVNAKENTEAILALALSARIEVDEIISMAQAAGAQLTPTQDHGWMYQRGFEDLDGHLWEVFHMDMSKAPQQA